MLKRKLSEIGSDLYRALIFPFVRIAIELKTGSILKQRTYINKGTILRGKNYIGRGTKLSNVDLGYGSYVSFNSELSNAKIGKYCSIGAGLVSVGGSHPVREFVSTHPAFFAKETPVGFSYVNVNLFKENKYVDEKMGYCYELGNDVWIGTNVSICQGVKIGDGACVGTGAVVLKDIEPYAIYAGVPARKIGSRFDEDTVNRLLSMKWWDKDEEWIKAHAVEFKNSDAFISEN